MFKYYKEVPTTTYVWYKLLDKAEKPLATFANSPCYASIAHGFDDAAQKIHVYHDKDKVPYDLVSVKRWIMDLNAMGFPCTFVEDENAPSVKLARHMQATVAEGLDEMATAFMRHGVDTEPSSFNFYVELKDYEDKNHLFSTLSLIRCLTESGICKVPEVYFGLMDQDPERDKLEAVQLAHRNVSNRERKYAWGTPDYGDHSHYANTGHMVTYDGNGKNITQDRLLARFKKAKLNLRDKGYLRLNANWNGAEID